MKPTFLLSLLVLLLGLTACGPVYQTDYHMVPPADAMGRQCSNGCLDRMQLCKSQCTIQDQNCEQMARLEAQNTYLSYVNERQRKGKPIEHDQDDFYHYSRCGGTSSCEETCDSVHRMCHTNCGGQVLERTYCTAFCQ